MIAVKAARNSGLIAFLLTASVALLHDGKAMADPSPDFEWRPDQGLLSLNARQAPLRQLLENLSQSAGFKLWISPDLQPPPLDIALDAMPLSEALPRILKGYSYALSRDSRARVTSVYVMHRGEDGPAPMEIAADSEQERILARVAASTQIPDSAKSVLLMQHLSGGPAAMSDPQQVRFQALETLLQHVQRVGAVTPDSMNRLRARLQQERESDESR